MTVELRALRRADLPAARALLGEACELDRAEVVAAEVLFGAAPGVLKTTTFGAFADGELAGVSATSGPWLRILAVHPAARGRGLGTVLLAAAESDVTAAGELRIRTLAQPGNYLAPGIDVRNAETIEWLERRGYERGAENTNLLIDVASSDRATPEHLAALVSRSAGAGYEVRRARRAQASRLAGEIGERFSPAWAFEVEAALRSDPPGVHVATAAGELAAFAVHDGNNRGLGWFGPAGTFEEHRGRGLGETLLVACLVDVAAAGHDVCTIAWIGPRAFYEKSAGVIGERRFVVMHKDLENE